MQADEEPAEDRPESLPEQVGRLASDVGRLAYRTRGSWTLLGCVAFFLVLRIALSLSPNFVSAISSDSVWLDVPLKFLSGVLSNDLIFVGLWTGLGVGSVGYRWTIGILTTALVCCLPIAIRGIVTGTAGLKPFFVAYMTSAQLSVWIPWIAVGLTFRASGRCLFGRSLPTTGSNRVRLGDLMLLTTIVALLFGAHTLAMEQFARSGSIQRIDSASKYFEILSLISWLLVSIVPLLPVLSTAFPKGQIKRKWLICGAITSFGLLVAAALTQQYYLSLVTGISSNNLTFDYMALMGIAALGQVIGVIGVAYWTRWAGYRMMSVVGRSKR